MIEMFIWKNRISFTSAKLFKKKNDILFGLYETVPNWSIILRI